MRTDGFVPLRPPVRSGEQHLPANGTDYADRSACQDGDPAHRVCRRTPQSGHGADSLRAERRQSPSAPDIDDGTDDDLRVVPADGGKWRRANGNRSLGTGAVGGMVIGTLALLFIVPSLFIAFQWLQERIRPVQAEPTHDWQIEEEIVASDREKKEAKGGALKE